MCGLIGAAVDSGTGLTDRMQAGLDALRHRGPNHQDALRFEYSGKELWLGHTRLSIIDLASAADQPMYSDDGRYVLVFNGEIYNYIELRDELRALGVQFRTASDTEVLLNAWVKWGESCLGRLDGMFAFAVFDKIAGTLVCARDPFGIKPFFYSTIGGAFYFASELPAVLDLLPSRPGPDLQRAYDYLVHGDYDSSERTFVDGVSQLMPAHLLSLDVATCKITSMRRWWSPNIEQTSKLSFAEATDVVRDIFLRNIRRQLRSDVPLGAALSGGIDSSAVVCAMRHVEPDLPIHTFSFVASNAGLSEERWVDIVNEHVGATAHKVSADAEELARDIDDLVRMQGEPFGSTSIYAQYRVFKLARESGITVTLDGQGADELLAGYNGYSGYRMLSLLSRGKGIHALRFARAWSQWPGRSYRQTAFDLFRETFSDRAYAGVRRWTGRQVTPKWIDAAMLRAAGVRMSEDRYRDRDVAADRRVIGHLRSSLQNRGLPGLLRHGDRNSMRFSIESRVPFLTSEFCEFLYAQPEQYLISESGETKSVFRAAMRGIVPDEILDRKDKVGFATPERAWLQSIFPVLRTWLGGAASIPFLSGAEVIRQSENALMDPKKFSWQTWRLANYARWWHLMHLDSDTQVLRACSKGN
ncbi:asparagine synthase (glutamine-hydrolyzing) [Rhodanobacter sp. DHB23]|uniref:asparagine synthase (glutamine-hydrolyzing) n=1 Tax=Rhodanobacter sp. DHB23 TaxID=2775923 RepID=UPI0017852B62|nr:asparagine synthase (glutamine-hydrolyzing) [Rhodanobacter sp. DHB23]MBD8872849.1 asparagine synthase (glutamine-hydrolyzing) [Rhodanobacter sp. DHB23]